MKGLRCDLGVATVVSSEDRVLLVKEGSGPFKGKWGLPKGFVNDGELPRDAALRELKEECGLDGKVLGLNSLREKVLNGIQAVFIVYDVQVGSGQNPKACSEIDEVGYIQKSNFDQIDWISETMKTIALNSKPNFSSLVVDYSTKQGHPYLLYLPREAI